MKIINELENLLNTIKRHVFHIFICRVLNFCVDQKCARFNFIISMKSTTRILFTKLHVCLEYYYIPNIHI